MRETPPTRIQRRRTKGWKMPEGAVYVGRPTKFSNPYSVKVWGSRARAVGEFRALMSRWPEFVEMTAELRGKTLACWCPLEDRDGNRVPCHADVLLEIANS